MWFLNEVYVAWRWMYRGFHPAILSGRALTCARFRDRIELVPMCEAIVIGTRFHGGACWLSLAGGWCCVW